MTDSTTLAASFNIEPLRQYTEPEAAAILRMKPDTLRQHRGGRRGGSKIGYLRLAGKPLYLGTHLIDYLIRVEQCPDQNEEKPSNTSSANGGYGADASKAEQIHGTDAGTTSRPDAQSESAWLEKILQKPKPNSTDGTLSSRSRTTQSRATPSAAREGATG